MTYRFRALGHRRYQLGEGARTSGDEFVFVDLLAGNLYRTDGTDAPRLVAGVGAPLGAVAPTARGGWVAAADTGFALLDGGLEWIARPEDGATTSMRMNDATVDPRGRFWAGSMAYDGTEGAGSLYRLDTDLRVHKVLGGLTVPNGPVFDRSGQTMYLAESATGTIYTCTVDAERGTPGPLRVFAQLDGVSPDGMTVDADGYVWSAIWAGSRLHRYAPDGTLHQVLELPARQPTSVVISSHEPWRMLVTTATHGLVNTEHDDGRLLIAAAAVAGVAVPPFG